MEPRVQRAAVATVALTVAANATAVPTVSAGARCGSVGRVRDGAAAEDGDLCRAEELYTKLRAESRKDERLGWLVSGSTSGPELLALGQCPSSAFARHSSSSEPSDSLGPGQCQASTEAGTSPQGTYVLGWSVGRSSRALSIELPARSSRGVGGQQFLSGGLHCPDHLLKSRCESHRPHATIRRAPREFRP